MRNHPAERARQIAAVERAGIDPRVGAWPGDPGGPSAEARLQGDNAAAPNRATRKHERDAVREYLEEVLEGPLYRSALEDCENYRPEDCAGPLSGGADGHYRCDVHADAYADVHDAGPAPATVDPATLEREALDSDFEADRLLAQAVVARAKAEHLRSLALLAYEVTGELTLCPVCGAGVSDCETDGCGIAPEDARNANVLGVHANVLYDLAADVEAQSRSHAGRVSMLRDRAEDLQDRADGAA